MKPTPFTLAHDALLRPTRFATYLEGGWPNIRRAALAVVIWLGALLILIGVILPLLLPLSPISLILAIILAPTMAMMPAGMAIIIGSNTYSTRTNTFFWLLRCQLAVTPPMGLLLLFGTSNLPLFAPWMPVFVIGLFWLIGLWTGGILSVKLIEPSVRDEAAAVRWFVGGAALVLGGLIWWLAITNPTDIGVFALILIGLSSGVLRPLNWLWAAPLSLALALASRLGVPVERLQHWHPVTLDELVLLPLPGLRYLLCQACADDLEQGAEWLLVVADHPGQRGAAQRALDMIIAQGTLAHLLLFWLSTCREGRALLQRYNDQVRPAHPLILAYAALSRGVEPAEWPQVIEQHRDHLAKLDGLPSTELLLTLIDLGRAALAASRWSEVVQTAAALPRLHAPPAVAPDPLWTAVIDLQDWLAAPAPTLLAESHTLARALWAEAQQLIEQNMDGKPGEPPRLAWPADLLAAASEHLLFLIEIERRRGAWLC